MHEHQALEKCFHRPLSQQAFTQFNILQDQLHGLTLTDDSDKWTYTWASPNYSAMKMYKHLFAKNGAHFIFRQLWKSNCRLSHKIFFWMLLDDRVSTRNMLHRKNMYLLDYNCALCLDRTQETLIHLF